MRLFVVGFFAFVNGALAAIFAYRSVVPMPNDAIARGKVLQSGGDYFFQSASEVFPTRTVTRSLNSAPLPERAGRLDSFTYQHDGKTMTLDNMFSDMETSGLIILQDGELVYEKYARGADQGTHFTTWSLVKSITSTLVGVAVADGLIASVDDPLSVYLPEVKGTAYEGVTIKQTMEMSSGVRFDPKLWEGDVSDSIKFLTDSTITGKTPAFELALKYQREATPGTKFNYNTAESQILLELVRRVTGRDAADYLQDRLWRPLGMEHDAAWIIDRAGPEGAEIGGAMFNAALRDWARFGLFIQQGGTWNDQQILPEDWVDRATVSRDPHLMPASVPHPSGKRGYGWHWWTFADGTFTASGANGQSLFIDRANGLVVARASAWPEGYVLAHDQHTDSLYKALSAWAKEERKARLDETVAELERLTEGLPLLDIEEALKRVEAPSEEAAPVGDTEGTQEVSETQPDSEIGDTQPVD